MRSASVFGSPGSATNGSCGTCVGNSWARLSTPSVETVSRKLVSCRELGLRGAHTLSRRATCGRKSSHFRSREIDRPRRVSVRPQSAQRFGVALANLRRRIRLWLDSLPARPAREGERFPCDRPAVASHALLSGGCARQGRQPAPLRPSRARLCRGLPFGRRRLCRLEVSRALLGELSTGEVGVKAGLVGRQEELPGLSRSDAFRQFVVARDDVIRIAIRLNE